MSTATPAAPVPQDWWMYHGDPAHSGCVAPGSSPIDSTTVGTLAALHTVQLAGPVLGVPAVVGGYAYVGTANSHLSYGSNGGAFYKVELATGAVAATFTWDIPLDERDSHGFTGMGCSPAVTSGQVFFSAFNGKLYCLSADDLTAQWITDLRYADPLHNQPVNNNLGSDADPVAAGWSSPVVAGGKVYVGMGEGENPELYGFIYCLDAATGDVDWIFCTCQFDASTPNLPNQLPADVLSGPPPAGFTVYTGEPVSRGCSIWSSIAYDATLGQLYATIGNPMPEPLFDGQGNPLPALPRPGYCYGILSLDAATGTFAGFWQIPPESSYRTTDIDIDFAGSPTLFDRPDGTRAVAAGCKNGGFFVLDAATLLPFPNTGQTPASSWRQLLPYDTSGNQIATVDAHVPSSSSSLNPQVTNAQSNAVQQENFYGTYSTPAVHPTLNLLFIGLGGSNDNLVAAGIDSQSTPFMRAMHSDTLLDAWPMSPIQVPTVDGTVSVMAYTGSTPPMYTNPAECALSLPVVVNDVVLCATTHVSLYAFNASTGALLWSDSLGMQTLGLNGGYGFCFGPAVYGSYVVAAALVNGMDGGILKIYSLPS
ncbi:MAG: Quino(hemo)protein alcohol dehydrogenase, PQQ-dependent [Gemmatimonadetes bacterium]|nr:Quino(hemo)protein alcohol dehydrogenase, PQQ-dependent [Gemmatimonadota bacterium]